MTDGDTHEQGGAVESADAHWVLLSTDTIDDDFVGDSYGVLTDSSECWEGCYAMLADVLTAPSNHHLDPEQTLSWTMLSEDFWMSEHHRLEPYVDRFYTARRTSWGPPSEPVTGDTGMTDEQVQSEEQHVRGVISSIFGNGVRAITLPEKACDLIRQRDAAIRRETAEERDTLRAALKEIIALEDRGVGVTLANDKLREAQAIARKALTASGGK